MVFGAWTLGWVEKSLCLTCSFISLSTELYRPTCQGTPLLQASWWLVGFLTLIFMWLSGRVGPLQPHLTGAALAIPVFRILMDCFVWNWNRADRFPWKAYITFTVQNKWLKFPVSFCRSDHRVLTGAFGSWFLLEVCFQLWVLSFETWLAERWLRAALLE